MYAKRPARSRRRPLAGAASAVTLAVLVAAVLTSAPPRPGDDVDLAAAVVPAQAAAGATLRVGPGAQYTTLADAARAARPGDTVLVTPGNYAGFQAPTSGTAGAPITFKADGGKVTLTSGGTSNGRLDLSGRSNLRFVGIDVSRSSRFGIYATNAQNITLQDCEIADSQDGGAVFVGGSNIRVIGCDVHGNNARGTSADMEGISLENVDGFEIAGNHVHDNGEEGIDAKYEARNGTIHGNRVENNRGPNIYVDSAHQIKVYDNISIGAKESSKAGIALAVENYSKTRKTYSVQIYNNVMIGNAGGGMSFWTEGSGSFTDISVVNNTFVNNKKAGISIAGGQFAGTNILRNNLFSGNPTAVSGSASAFKADHTTCSPATGSAPTW
ncbi:nitrous oxide reductase family maturation protein NosD [Pseudonocardia sulfidoxydans]|uniref:right-handed parallel beta-helix repeat-containing protein n=1 Tax=Pseudonocardia sulfidoxydans TaxID=54011 RepID=UPI003623A590